MKTKYFFTVLALSALFVSCSQKELITPSANNDTTSNLIEVGDNFMIAGGFNNDATKSNWDLDPEEGLFFEWHPLSTGTSNNFINGNGVNAPLIGLCWTGEYTINNEPVGAVADYAMTNYKFIHNGWLAKDDVAETAETVAAWNPCTEEGDLLNGYLYSDATNDASADVDFTTSLYLNDDDITALNNAKDALTDDSEPNYRTGVFKTENSTIFTGKYIVYYPYTDKFNDYSPIIATAPQTLTGLAEGTGAKRQPIIGDNTFSYGNATITEGGTMADGFSFHNLSGILNLQVKIAADAATKTIDKIVLTCDEDFVIETGISASKIRSGLTGADLFVGEATTAPSLVLDIVNVDFYAGNTYYFYYPVMPSKSINNMKAIIYSTDGTSAIVPVTLAYGTEIKAGKGQSAKMEVKKDMYETRYIAFDYDSFDKAIQDAAGATEDDPVEIEVVGDIVLEANQTVPAYTTVTGGKIIVPENNVVANPITYTIDKFATQASTVVLRGGCCGNVNGGKLVVDEGTVTGNVEMASAKVMDDSFVSGIVSLIDNDNTNEDIPTISGKISGNGDVYVAEEIAASLGEISLDKYSLLSVGKLSYAEFSGNVEVKGTVTIGENDVTIPTTPVYTGAEADFLGNLTVNNMNVWSCKDDAATPTINEFSTVNCEGTLTVNKNLTVFEGAKMNLKNAVVAPKAAILLKADNGTKQSTTQTVVTVEGGTLTNNGTITVNYGTAKVSGDQEYDANLVFNSTGILSNNGVMQIYGLLTVDGTATNNVGGKIFDRVSANISGANALMLGTPGEYISEVNDPGQRYKQALSVKPTTILSFVPSANNLETYDLSLTPSASIRLYEVNSTGKEVRFESKTENYFATIPALTVNAGTCTVYATNDNLTTTKDYLKKLTVSGNVTVNKGGVLNIFNLYNMAEPEYCVFAANLDVTVKAGGVFSVGAALPGTEPTAVKATYAESLASFNTEAKTNVAVAAQMIVDFNSIFQTKDLVLNGNGNIKGGTGTGMPAYVFFSGTKDSDKATWANGSGRPIKRDRPATTK